MWRSVEVEGGEVGGLRESAREARKGALQEGSHSEYAEGSPSGGRVAMMFDGDYITDVRNGARTQP